MAFDALTKLADRGAFDSELAIEVGAGSADEPLALVFVDVDHFKKVNDTQGHQKGDAVLSAVANLLESIARRKGKVFRYGGEEMVILLPNHSADEAIAVAERCRLSVEAGMPGGIPITASFGISLYPTISPNATELVSDADRAMYDAKSRGRNLVRLAGEPEPPHKETARKPDRKQPQGSRFSEMQMATMKKTYFQRGGIECPDDATPLRVREINEIGRSTPRLLIMCPVCGLNEVIQ